MASWSSFLFSSARRSPTLGLAIALALGSATIVASGGCTLNTAGLSAGGSGGTSSTSITTSTTTSVTSTTTSTSSSTATSTSTGSMSCMNDDDCDPAPKGSCMKKVCKSSVCEDKVDTANKPTDDDNPCTKEACSPQGAPHPGVPTGDPCEGKTGFCNSSGTCVVCLKDSDCTGTSAACNMTSYTCFSCSDGVKNGKETSIDCGGEVCKTCTGEPCGNATDCATGFCADGVCCNKDCSGTCQTCNVPGSIGTCSSVPVGQADGNCSGMKACNGVNACKTAAGFACGDDDVCASGICFGGICLVQANGACSDDAACGSGLCSGAFCKECNAGNQCKSMMCTSSTCKAPGGAPCEASSDCAGGLCQNNFCALANMSACAVNEDCKSGYCNGGACKPCSSNGDCPGSAKCGNAYFGANVCERPSGSYCFTDTQCAVATGGKCVGFPAKCQ